MESCFATVYCVCLISFLSSVQRPLLAFVGGVFQTHRWDKQRGERVSLLWKINGSHPGNPLAWHVPYFPCNSSTPSSQRILLSPNSLILQVSSSGKPFADHLWGHQSLLHPPVELMLLSSCFVSDSMCFWRHSRIFPAHNGKDTRYNNHYC